MQKNLWHKFRIQKIYSHVDKLTRKQVLSSKKN